MGTHTHIFMLQVIFIYMSSLPYTMKKVKIGVYIDEKLLEDLRKYVIKKYGTIHMLSAEINNVIRDYLEEQK